MRKALLLSLSALALLSAVPAHAATSTDTSAAVTAPAKATEEGAQPSAAAPSQAMDAQKDATPSADANNAMGAPEAGDKEVPQAAAPEATAAAAPEAAPEAAPAEEGSSHAAPKVPDMDWSWEGPFGTFDRAQLQRGFQVYKQVCAACHSMNRVYFRNLAALGYNEAEIKSIAAEYQIQDGPNDDGDMFDRPGRPSDHFKAPFANDQQARASNGGALPPDLSLIVRARANGSNYVHGILTGFTEPPAGFVLGNGMHYNKYFPGHQIAMPQPLMEGSVTYDDGTQASIDQEAQDVTAFLTWASEPMMEKRKQTGLKVILFLLVFCGLMYATKRKVWRNVH
jgi:ubiquinol-cytochrome c reductase cytochrome c1 subunit